MFIGGKLTKHIAQISCNSSIIEHYDIDSNDSESIPEKLNQVACGMYPAVSMMNHSCKTNVSM